MKKSNTLLLITAVLIIVAGALGFYVYKQEKQRTEEDTRIADTINPYYKRLDEITSELSQLERENTVELKYTGIVNFLFELPSSKIDDEVVNQLEAAGYKGIITINENAYPDKWECLSASRMKELCERGWTIALSLEQPSYLNWDGATKKTPAELISSLSKRLENGGLPKAEALYVTDELTDEIKTAAKDAGIHAIICSDIDTTVTGLKDYLPATGTGLKSKDAAERETNASENRNVCIYVIGFEEGDKEYSSEALKEVTDRLSESLKDGTLQTMSLENAYQYYTNIFSEYEKEKTVYEEKVRVLEEEEKEIESKIAGYRPTAN